MSTISSKGSSSARLEIRMRPEFKDIIAKAAAVLGQSITEYTVSRLVESARHDIQEHETIVLSDRDRDAFLALLDAPPEPNAAMKRAAARYKKARI